MLDLETAKKLFTTLYSDTNGYLISSDARNKLHYHDKAHTYGEIAPDSFYRILSEVEPQPGEVFYDLGSGTGKAVVLAAMLYDFSRCVGIELLRELWEAAEQVKARYEKEMRQTIEFVNKDFLTCDLSDAGVVFTHSTCFYDELWIKLLEKFRQLPAGARVITVTKSALVPWLELLNSAEYQMGWGRATVYFYRKV